RGRLGDLLVRDPSAPHLELRVDGEHDEPRLARAVVLDGLRDRRASSRLEVLHRGLVEFTAVLVRRLPARNFRVRVDVEGDQLVDVHGFHRGNDLGTSVAGRGPRRGRLHTSQIRMTCAPGESAYWESTSSARCSITG